MTIIHGDVVRLGNVEHITTEKYTWLLLPMRWHVSCNSVQITATLILRTFANLFNGQFKS